MADALPLTVRAFMIRSGRTTAAEADTKGMDVLDDLPLLEAVAIFSMCQTARKRDDLIVQKAALLATNTEMQKNNLSIQNWKERGMIAASTTWPTDQASIDKLIGLLDADPAPPGPPLPDPPTQQDASEADVTASRKRNEAIRIELDKAAKAGTSEPFTTNPELARAFGAWLERQGVDAAQSADSVFVSFDGTSYTSLSKVMTPFVTPSTPAVVSLPLGDPRQPPFYWLGKEFGSGPLVLEAAQQEPGAVYGPPIIQMLIKTGFDDRDGVHREVDGQLWKEDGGLFGVIMRNGDHYFAISSSYTPSPLMSDGVGGVPGEKGVDDRLYWSNGTKFYVLDPTIATPASIEDFIEKDGGDQAIASGIEHGTPYLGFTAPGGPWTEVQPKDLHISNPTPETRGKWATHFDDQIDKFQASNNLWSAQSGAQQVRMQDDISQYSSFLGISSNITQNNNRVLERLMPGR